MAVMLYQKGQELCWEGLWLVTKIVQEAEVAAHTAAGWFLHPHETIEVPAATGEAGATALDPAAVAAAAAIPATDMTAPQTAAADAALHAPGGFNPFAPPTE